ncbi:MAG TPA: molybdate ABC transporter substrate-binding protein [Polyangia bacterium]|jgi:molybdate transport system substrate-binding protein|nr:molybdate ABC transporter substrate-binding protein [Polyangia bacterium]
MRRTTSVTTSVLPAVFVAVWVALSGLGPAIAAKPPSGELVVFEAASLKEAFATLASRFEKDHPGAHVVANTAGSQELRAQIEHGAVGDVFASADQRHMSALATEGLVVGPALFACNEPVVVVRSALGASLKTFADLPRAERIVVGAPEVPIGAYTLQIFQKAGASYGAGFAAQLQAKIVSHELNVRQVLAKVVLGEADAGIVYRSDAMAAKGKVAVVAIPAELNVTAAYPIAMLKAAPRPELARAFVDLVRSPAGAAVLREAGFVPCPGR